MYDMAIWGDEEMDNAGIEFRRVRFYNSGELYGNVKYKLQLDFADGKIDFKDVWMELGELPFQGKVRIGNFKEPFRLESITSSKYITFMERALPIAMSKERNTGAMYHNIFGEKVSLQTGIFLQGDSFGNDKKITKKVKITSRITYLAMNDGNKLLHLGASNSIRKIRDKTYRFSSRAENHLGTNLLEIEFTDVEKTNIFGWEIAYVNNFLSIQAEYLQANVVEAVETELSSYYGQISYFLTGESRLYISSLNGFGRVKPNNNYGGGGKGAFELVARISNMDLAAANEGTLDDITLGMNWYLNPYTRVMLNYVMGEKTDFSGEVTNEDAVMMRIQVDF
jgi:phosphate-selective porin OprO/OprP